MSLDGQATSADMTEDTVQTRLNATDLLSSMDTSNHPESKRSINSENPSPKRLKSSPRRSRPIKFSPRKMKERPQTNESTTASPGKKVGEGFSGEVGEAYYSSNFKEVLRMCLLPSNPERHVISTDEESVVEDFMILNESHQRLYVRLFLRKHQWIRTSKVKYEDIASDLDPIFKELCDKRFLMCESDLKDPSIILNLFQVHELKSLCKQFHMSSKSSKPKIIEALFKQDREHQPLFGKTQFMSSVIIKAKPLLGRCIKVAEKPAEVFSKLMLLFSICNDWMAKDEEFDFSQIIYRMLQVNIGRLVYTDYQILVTRPLFKDKESFECYYRAVKEEQTFQQSVENSEQNIANKILRSRKESLEQILKIGYIDSSLPSFLLPFIRGHVCVRVLSRGVEFLEKTGRYSEANELLDMLLLQGVYGRGHRGKWWERLALNWDYHLKNKVKCLDVIKKAFDDPYLNQPIRLSLIQRAHRILQSKGPKKRSISVKNDTDVTKIGTYTLDDFPMEDSFAIKAPEISIDGKQLHSDNKPFFLGKPQQGSSYSSNSQSLFGVEGYAIDHYMKEKGWPCAIHAENSTFLMLFALLMWDIIFTSVPDVFRSSFQGAPLDLYTKCFYNNRKAMIDSKIQWIRASSAEEISSAISVSWEVNYGYVCTGVNWDLFPSGVKDAKDIALSLGQEVLGNICELFSKNYRGSSSGLPDLTLWDPEKSAVKFVEVKGPGDKLSSKQMIWLSRLTEWNCSVEVCHVRALC